jgi:hypothetical protein
MSAPFGASERELTGNGRDAADWRLIPVRILFLLAIGFLIWLPRGLDLDRMVTPDEPLWLARSANFVKGIASSNFDQTYQYAHPGVTVMWAGTIGYLVHASDYIDDGPETVRQSNNVIASELENLSISPLATMEATRKSIVIFVVVVLTLSAWYAVRLFGLGPGLIGSAFLATDPFHVALSRLLHLDGLLSALVGLAALTWLTYLFRGRRRIDLIMAGVFVGLAGLTRTLAVVLLPMMLISAWLEIHPHRSTIASLRGQVWARARPVIAVGAIALVTFVALWPAMWTSPIATTTDFIKVGFELGQNAHERPIFFNGEIYNAVDPGALFYPASFIWRTTPAMLAGLLLTAFVLVVGLRVRDRSVQYRPALYLLLLAATILIVLDLSDKKLDRYIIPIVPPLAFVSGWGFGVAGRLLARFAGRRNSRFSEEIALGAVSILLIAFNVVAIVRHHPYGLSYYNPLLGGPPEAERVLMVGWGEGLDQIAEAVLELPDAAEMRVITSSWKSPLSYFVEEPQIATYAFTNPDALERWLRSDFYIWYITPAQRGYIPPEMEGYLATQQPVATVKLGGLTYAALYDLRTAPIPDYFLAQSWMTTLAPDLQLVTATIPLDPLVPGAPVTALFYLTGAPAIDPDAHVQLILTAPDGTQIAGKAQTLPVTDGRTVWSVRRRIDLPADAALGTYWVTARFTAGAESQDVVLGSVTVQSEPAPVTEPSEDEQDELDTEG